MSAHLSWLFSDDETDMLRLGEILMPKGRDELGEGQPVRVQGQNTGETVLRDVSVRVDGEGRENVQLAIDFAGEPGVWAQPGEPVIVHEGSLFRGESFTLWVKGIYSYEDDEAKRPFRLIASATSIGG